MNKINEQEGSCTQNVVLGKYICGSVGQSLGAKNGQWSNSVIDQQWKPICVVSTFTFYHSL